MKGSQYNIKSINITFVNKITRRNYFKFLNQTLYGVATFMNCKIFLKTKMNHFSNINFEIV